MALVQSCGSKRRVTITCMRVTKATGGSGCERRLSLVVIRPTQISEHTRAVAIFLLWIFIWIFQCFCAAEQHSSTLHSSRVLTGTNDRRRLPADCCLVLKVPAVLTRVSHSGIPLAPHATTWRCHIRSTCYPHRLHGFRLAGFRIDRDLVVSAVSLGQM